MRGNVDYLTIAETKKNLLHVKIIKIKLMYEVITINLINLQFICLLNVTQLFLTNKRQNARGSKFA